jgi:5-methyltetrahydrofolate--homocysteine methyltransferase
LEPSKTGGRRGASALTAEFANGASYMTDTLLCDQRLRRAVLDGDAAAAASLVAEGLASGIPPRTLLDEGLIAAMDEAGRLFEAGDQPRESAGRIAIGTVAGDLHDIGKNLVATMLRGAGFDVDDLGVDVTPSQFVEAARAGANVIGISSLLTTTMISMRAAVQALEEAGLRDRVKVMVGGAPVTPEYADAIGADGFSDNAGGAVTLARRLVAQARPS